MQTCSHCRRILIIGLTGELHENGTDAPDIECLNCGQLNEPAKPVYETRSLFEGNDDDGSPMCVMCGKEFSTYLRSDGKYYCTQCWRVWNS